MDGAKLQNAIDVVSFYEKKKEKHVAYPNAHRNMSKLFYLVKPKDIDQSVAWDYKSIPSFQSMHSMAFVSPQDITLFKLRQLTCFCPNYMDDNAKFFEKKSHVPPWKLLTLEPTNVTQV